jgi:hypothetical protein
VNVEFKFAEKLFLQVYKAAQSANQIDQDANHQAKQKREINFKFEQTNEME